jgi:hypothetical protein
MAHIGGKRGELAAARVETAEDLFLRGACTPVYELIMEGNQLGGVITRTVLSDTAVGRNSQRGEESVRRDGCEYGGDKEGALVGKGCPGC